MNILVAYASRHGATRGIADRIAAGLRAAGLSADVRPVSEVQEPERYEAFVIGSAAYTGRWLKEASTFVRNHRQVLGERPVWLFSSGPIGTERVDRHGRDVLEASRPKEFDEFHPVLHPRGERVFFGAWDPQAPPVGFVERLQRLLPASWIADVAGDFRDWAAIDAWAHEIAAELTRAGAAASPGEPVSTPSADPEAHESAPPARP